MAMNIVEKILSAHRVSGSLVPGGELAIRIDQTLTQDATGTMADLQFESMGLERVKADLAVSYVDHNTIQVGFENADDHAYLKSVAQRYGIVFSRPGNGICHQLHLERFGKPGATLLGSDSHTPTGGGVGMLAIGAGGIDVAVAMGGGPFYLTCPKVTRVWLTGALPPGVSAKDVILNVLSVYGTKGNVGRVLEYGGPGVAGLGVPARATITNMGAELGVTTSVFPSDAATRAFLRAQGRERDWSELVADEGAAYDQTVEIDLGAVEPMAACPHSPGNVATIASMAGRKVNQVLIGSCTNSSYRDLKTVALMLRGRKVHPDVEVGVAPGSRQVVAMLAREGLLTDLVAAGARILENACGFCIGNHMSPGTDAVSLRTSNRNFEGRSGTQSAQVFLVSPETAAAAALSGVFTDPRACDAVPPAVAEPAVFDIDDSMFLFRETAGRGGPGTPVVRGPNIGQVPAGQPLPETLDGIAAIKVGDKITTDHIMPAGARLKYRSNVPQYAKYVFEHVDPAFYANASANRDAGRHNVIVAGESYGQGSSREHAAMCPMYLGVKAVLAKSIERIHCANLINFGIVPLIFDNPSDYEAVAQGDRLVAGGLREAVAGDGKVTVTNETRGTVFTVSASLSDRQKKIILGGGLLAAVASGAIA
ncbi:MAG: aconitate hydratase [Verrucomicrobiota bacterium]|jgi:aconitate hydratase|nr:aconitate hydratase [Verrucomicrobiota bacterium]